MYKFTNIALLNNLGTLLLFLIFCLSFNVNAQIRGAVYNETEEKIKFTNIIVKKDINNTKIEEFIISNTGDFNLKLNDKLNQIFIIFTAVNYDSKVIELDLDSYDYNQDLKVVLQKQKVVQIEEVIIKKNTKPVEVKKDTILYDVSKFRSESDRKLNDVLKKLPGIIVNEKSGEVKYNGKSIETIKIEGDDLFGNNYTIGSKNINIDIVEKIEAIENYSSNEMLAGIENSDKVALNLKLKKRKIDFSGSIDWGSGFDDNKRQIQNVNSTFLQIASKFKSFINLSYNNIGVNTSPIDYFSNTSSVELIKNNQYYAKKIISDNSFETNIEDVRSNFNNQIFGSYNSVFKLFNNNSTRVNFYYLKDRITQNIFENSSIENSIFLTNSYNFSKNPQNFNLDLYSKQKIFSNSLIEFSFVNFNEKILQNNSIIQNGLDNIETHLHSKNNFLKTNLTLTSKLAANRALQFIVNYSNNNSPQKLFLEPSVQINNLNINNQYSKFNKSIYDFTFLYHINKEKYKYLFSLGTLLDKSIYTSKNNEYNFNNYFIYHKNSYFMYSNLSFKLNSFNINTSMNMMILNQQLKNQNNLKNIHYILEPNLNLRYKINAINAIIAALNYTQKPFMEDRLFENPVLINHRTIIVNRPSLDLQKKIAYKIKYIFNNDFEQTKFSVGINYNQEIGNYFSEININPNISKNTYYFKPNKIFTKSFDLYFDKYFTFLDCVIKLYSTYSIVDNQNIVNNSQVRNVENNSLINDLTYRTVFSFPINFENKFSYQLSFNYVDNLRNNTLKSFNNSFKVFYRPNKKTSLNLSFDYFKPNTKKSTDFTFFDISLSHKINQKNEIAFISKNILNKSAITSTNINDYSVSTTITNILPRQLMIFFSYSF